MAGAPPLPVKAYRQYLALELSPSTNEALQQQLEAGKPHSDLLERWLSSLMRRFAEQLGGSFAASYGSVGCLPGDGLTYYYDVVSEDCLGWTYIGTDYGHSLEAELAADSDDALQRALDAFRKALGDDFEAHERKGRMPERADG